MTSPVYDTAIIGGGPAGASAAIRLASLGFKVLLLEAKTFPHHKMCGEFLSPECLPLLDQLGMKNRLAALCPPPIRNIRLTAPDGVIWEAPLPGKALGLSRWSLDASLADQARQVGVQVKEATTVTGVVGGLEDGFSLETVSGGLRTNFQSQTVLGAQGKRSRLDRSLDRAFLRQRQPFLAAKAYFHGPSLPGWVQLNAFPGGYCGLSQVENRDTVVCFLAHESTLKHAGEPGPGYMDRMLRWIQTQNPSLDGWLSQAEPAWERWITISQVPFQAKQRVEGDILMIGDAAGLIVPLAGDGIGMALQGGNLAAELINSYLNRDLSANSLRVEYTRSWEKLFGRRLRLGRILQATMIRPHLLSLVLRLLRSVPALGQYFLSQTRDLHP